MSRSTNLAPEHDPPPLVQLGGGFTCFACREAKSKYINPYEVAKLLLTIPRHYHPLSATHPAVKCNKEEPCSRCVKLGLTCVPQARKPGRPPTKGLAELNHEPIPPPPPPLLSVQPSPPRPPARPPDQIKVRNKTITAVAEKQALVPVGEVDSDWLIFSEEELEGTVIMVMFGFIDSMMVSMALMQWLLWHLYADFEDVRKTFTVEVSGEDSVTGRKRHTEDEEPDIETSGSDKGKKTRVLKVQRGAVSFKIAVPAHLADMMTGCLSRALSVQGHVSDIKANAVLRIWSLCAFRYGVDFTGGLLPNASRILSSAGYNLRTEDGLLFLGPEEDKAAGNEVTTACE